jgi:hypothetical protein
MNENNPHNLNDEGAGVLSVRVALRWNDPPTRSTTIGLLKYY